MADKGKLTAETSNAFSIDEATSRLNADIPVGQCPDRRERDTGSGMSRGCSGKKPFDPFFTTKQPG